MNPKYRALIWEQGRVGGVLAVCLSFFSGLVMAFHWYLAYWQHSITRGDAQETSLGAMLVAGILLSGIMILRQDTTGQLIPFFDARHTRLPIRTLPLVSILFFSRLLFLLFLCLAHLLLYRAAFKEMPPPLYVFLPLTIFLVAQTMSWCYRSITGISYLTIIVLFLIPALLAVSRNYEDGYFSAAEAMARGMSQAAVLLFLLPVTYGLCLIGVHWERRDERYGLPTERELLDAVTGMGATPAQRFSSPLEAQIWYERRRTGWMLPGITLLVLLVLLVVLVSVPDITNYYVSLTAQFTPLIALPFGAFVTGIYSLTDKCTYASLRPSGPSVYANAKLLALGRSLTWSVLIVSSLSIGGFLFVGSAEMAILREALAHRETTYIEITAILLAPCLLAAMAAWVALWVGIPIVAVLMAGIVLMLNMSMAFFNLIEMYVDVLSIILFCFYVYGSIFIVASALLWSTWRGYLSRTGFLAAAITWMTLAGFLLLIGPDTGEKWLYPLSLCLVFSGYVIVPVAALPHAFIRQHGR